MTTIEKAQASCLGPSEPTPGRRRSPRRSRLQPGSSSRRRGQLSPGIHHLIAAIRYMGKEVASNHEYSSKVLARLTSELFYLCIGFK